MENGVLLPKEVVPGAGSLVENLDKKILVWLRDGRMYVGILRSVDQFANLVLHHASERIQVGNNYADELQGVIVVRGENVALLGEVETELSIAQPTDVFLAAQARIEQRRRDWNKLKIIAYRRRGMIFTPDDYF